MTTLGHFSNQKRNLFYNLQHHFFVTKWQIFAQFFKKCWYYYILKKEIIYVNNL